MIAVLENLAERSRPPIDGVQLVEQLNGGRLVGERRAIGEARRESGRRVRKWRC